MDSLLSHTVSRSDLERLEGRLVIVCESSVPGPSLGVVRVRVFEVLSVVIHGPVVNAQDGLQAGTLSVHEQKFHAPVV